MRKAILFASLLWVWPFTVFAQPLDGLWVNGSGSVVEIKVNEKTHAVSGYYKTALGAPEATDQFALIGWVQGDVIAFSVSFEGFGSITSWSGQLVEDENGSYIRTLWHLTRNIEESDEVEEIWRSITSGYAEFRRVQNNSPQGVPEESD